MRISPLNRPTVLVTMGHGRGIGPEIIVRALSLQSIRRLANLLVIGDLHYIKKAKEIIKIPIALNKIDLWELINSKKMIFNRAAINILNIPSEDQSKAPLTYIDNAVMLINRMKAHALVTAPVSKKSIAKSGIKFTGHTEYLAELTKSKNIAMMFVGKNLKATLVTRHIPLKNVAKNLTQQKIIDAALLTGQFLKDRFKIKSPKIGICALNPHAGEGGMLGGEEKDLILPAIKRLKRRLPYITGPLPADSAFNLLYNGRVDVLIAMYHDQAMIPVKMIGRGSCVNVTLGLPFIRTSPAHGTAYDIAGKGIADPCGMIEAIRLAIKLSVFGRQPSADS